MKQRKERDLGLDMLRIGSMFMVTILHFFTHGDPTLTFGHYNFFLGHLLNGLFFVAVNCFVLISGYYQCTSTFKLKKLAAIWLQTFVYSVGLYTVLALLSGTFSPAAFIKSALPVVFEQYWFVTAYVLMYAVSPFLNKAIAAMDKRSHFACVCTLLGIFCVLQNMFYISDFSYIQDGYSFLWFCILYIVGAYLRLHVPVKKEHRGRCLLVYFLCIAVVVGERFAAWYLTPKIFGSVKMESLFFSYNSIFVTAASIALFLFFRTLQPTGKVSGKLISFFAPLCFGVYLIHDNVVVRPVLWDVLGAADTGDEWYMIPLRRGDLRGLLPDRMGA